MASKKPKISFAWRLGAVFASNRFFYAVLLFLVVSSSYVALVSLYPMAFDEEVHYGIIKAYSESVNPFALVQLQEYDRFGSIVTDPSYLFHYLMSFPYRVLAALFSSDTTIVILLRFINIALFAAAMVVFRMLLFAVGVTRAVSHVILAVIVLIPIVPLLAGQINYDNLTMLVIAGLLLAAWRFRELLRAHDAMAVRMLAIVSIVALLGSVVKYASLPILAVVFFFIVYEIYRALRSTGFRKFKVLMRVGISQLSLLWKVGLFVGLFLGIFLFSQRYVLNTIQYGSPVPNCDAVLTVERCRSFGPYGRDYNYQNNKDGLEVRSLPHYAATHFAWGLWHRLYFTIAGPTNTYANFRHLPVMSITALVIIAAAVIAVLVQFRSLFKRYPAFWLFLGIALVYVGALLFQLYATYMETARPAAINGRYLLLILPLVGAIGVTALAELAKRFQLQKYLGIIAIIVFALLLQGGGPISYMISAEASWFWNQPTAQINAFFDTVLSPFIYGR